MNDELLTVKQTAEYLKLSIKSIHRLITDKRLAASQVGSRSWRIRKVDIELFLKENTNLSKGDNSQ